MGSVEELLEKLHSLLELTRTLVLRIGEAAEPFRPPSLKYSCKTDHSELGLVNISVNALADAVTRTAVDIVPAASQAAAAIERQRECSILQHESALYQELFASKAVDLFLSGRHISLTSDLLNVESIAMSSVHSIAEESAVSLGRLYAYTTAGPYTLCLPMFRGSDVPSFPHSEKHLRNSYLHSVCVEEPTEKDAFKEERNWTRRRAVAASLPRQIFDKEAVPAPLKLEVLSAGAMDQLPELRYVHFKDSQKSAGRTATPSYTSEHTIIRDVNLPVQESNVGGRESEEEEEEEAEGEYLDFDAEESDDDEVATMEKKRPAEEIENTVLSKRHRHEENSEDSDGYQGLFDSI